MRKFLLLAGAGILGCLCFAKAQTITIGPVSGTITACLGSPSSNPNIQRFTVKGTNLINDITVVASDKFEASLSENSGYSPTLSLSKTNGSANAIIYVRAAVTSVPGDVTGTITLSSSPATPQIADVNGKINILPTVNTVGDQTKNNGDKTAPVNFTGTSQAYRWTNDNPAIGLATTGTGNIPSFTAVNFGNVPITANITVTPEPAGFIYAGNFNGSSVSVINSGSNKVVGIIPAGAGPFRTLVTPDGTRVYVSNSNDKTVTVIDAINNKFLTSIDVGSNPTFMNITSDGAKLFVCNAGSNTVSVIRTIDNKVVVTIPVGVNPGYSVMSPDGKHLYIGGDEPARVYVINTASNIVEFRMPPTPMITGIALNADGTRLYLSTESGKGIVVINTEAKTIIATIPIEGEPFLCDSPNPVGAFLYAANLFGNTVTVINTNTFKIVATIPVGSYCMPITMSPDGKYVYAVGRISKNLSVINTSTNKVISTIAINGLLDAPVVSADGSRVYITDDGENSVHIINTATNSILTNVTTGINPQLYRTSISNGNGCDGLSKSFKIIVAAAIPVINTAGTPDAVNTTYGTPSSSSSFVVSGKDLTQGITITPPPGFEISTDDNNFSNSLTVGGPGNTNDITIYTRLAATTNAGPYSGDFVLRSSGAADVKVHIDNSTVAPRPIMVFGSANKVYGDAIADQTLYYNTPGFDYPDVGLENGDKFYSLHFGFTAGNNAESPAGTYTDAVVVSDFEGQNGYLSSNYTITYTKGNVVVQPAPLIITAKSVNKPYGTTLTNIAASTDFTVTGLKNNETIGTVSVSYGSGSAATDLAGVYSGSVSVSAPTGGTFNPANYDITYVTADITINAAAPDITVANAPSPVNTIYGTPSEASSFTISGNTLSTGITVTPPDGFEVSTDNVNFSNTVIVGAAGTVNSTVVYIRLAATTDVGPYSGNITLIAGATQATVFMPTSTVSPAPITIAGVNETKTYGTTLQGYTGPDKFNIIAGSLKNGNTISSVTINYGTGANAGSPAGTYSGSVMPKAVTGANGFKATNYTVTFANADIIVLPANLTITADNQTRDYGADNPVLTFNYSGFVNGDTEAQLTTQPAASTPATTASAPGRYPIIVNGAASPNYTFTYVNGVLTINALPNAVLVVPNTFTPNGDGINDTWNLPALASYPNCTVNIYDRYGQMVFRSIGYSIPWDGRYNSKNVPPGVYYYLIDKKDNTGPVSGSLTVLR